VPSRTAQKESFRPQVPLRLPLLRLRSSYQTAIQKFTLYLVLNLKRYHSLKSKNFKVGFYLTAGIFLMGYGLVAIPRTMWREADVRSRQRLLCHQAGAQAKKALHAHHELTVVRLDSCCASC